MGDCKKCPFYKTEPVPEDLARKVNLTEWSSCDVDAVGLAAADRIANQSTHIAALQQEIEKLRGQNEQLREAAALVTKESAELLERRWIPVEERLPSGDELVLVIVSGKPKKNITLDGAVELATLYSDGWCLETWPEWTGADVTHWMPLPEPPEVEKC